MLIPYIMPKKGNKKSKTRSDDDERACAEKWFTYYMKRDEGVKKGDNMQPDNKKMKCGANAQLKNAHDAFIVNDMKLFKTVQNRDILIALYDVTADNLNVEESVAHDIVGRWVHGEKRSDLIDGGEPAGDDDGGGGDEEEEKEKDKEVMVEEQKEVEEKVVDEPDEPDESLDSKPIPSAMPHDLNDSDFFIPYDRANAASVKFEADVRAKLDEIVPDNNEPQEKPQSDEYKKLTLPVSLHLGFSPPEFHHLSPAVNGKVIDLLKDTMQFNFNSDGNIHVPKSNYLMDVKVPKDFDRHKNIYVNVKRFKLDEHSLANANTKAKKTKKGKQTSEIPFDSWDFVDLLQHITGFTPEKLNTIWTGADGKRKTAFTHDSVLESTNLKVIGEEAKWGKGKLQSPPTLFYVLQRWAADNDYPTSAVTARTLLDLLCVSFMCDKFGKFTSSTVVAGMKTDVERVRLMGKYVSLVYEVITGPTANLPIIGNVLPILFIGRKGEVAAEWGIGFDNRDNKRIIGLYLMASEDKASESKKTAREKSLQSNRAPVVFRRIDIHTLLRRMKDIINEKNTTDRVRCYAAAIVVEMCTGARISEVLAYSQFYAFKDLDSDTRKSLIDITKESVPSFTMPDIELAIVQQGVLKRRPDKKYSDFDDDDGDDDDVVVDDIGLKVVMSPKPVVLGVTPHEIQHLIYNIIRPVVAVVIKAFPKDKPGRDLDKVSPIHFAPVIKSVNSLLREKFPGAASYKESTGRAITSHALRKFYANYSYEQHSVGMVKNVWIQSVLGHDRSSLTASLAYTSATIEDTITFKGRPTDGGVSERIESAMSAMREDLDTLKTAVTMSGISGDVSLSSSAGVVPRLRKRLFEGSDHELVGVLMSPPLFTRRVMPRRERELRLSDQKERADVVYEYVHDNFTYIDGEHTYTVKPTWDNIRVCGFGYEYFKAFTSHYADYVADQLTQFDSLITQ